MLALTMILTVAVAVLALLVAGLLRSHANIVRALHSLGVTEETLTGDAPRPLPVRQRAPVEAAASDVVGLTPRGGVAKVGVVGTSHATLLAFLSTDCSACSSFWLAMQAEDFELPGVDVRIVVVARGPEEESSAAVAELAPPGLPVVMSSAAYAEYGVGATPYFVLVDGPSGRITGEGVALTWSQLAALARRAVAGDRGGRRGYRQRIEDTDAELAAAGVVPGDTRLFHSGDAT